MRKIDIITFGDLNVKTGVNKVIENLKIGEYILKEKNIQIGKIIGYTNTSIVRKKTLKLYLKNIIKIILEKLAIKSKKITFFIIYLKYILRAKKTIKKYVKLKSDAAVIIFHDIFSCSEYLKQQEKNNKKIILVLHTNGDTFKQIDIYYNNQSKETKKYLKNLEEEVIKKVDKIVFVSEKSLIVFTEKYKEYNNKCTYIYNGVVDILEKNKISFEEKPIKFICVGTINERKGQKLIFNTVKKLEKKLEDKVVFYIVGGGPEYSRYKNLVEKFNLEKIIKVLGEREDVEALLKQSHIFILPSYDEGLPIAIIEAMRAGLPIIATKVGGIPEMILNGREGYLINPIEDDIEDILNQVLDNKIALEKLSYFSRQKYEEQFSLEVMIKKYAEVINE